MGYDDSWFDDFLANDCFDNSLVTWGEFLGDLMFFELELNGDKFDRYKASYDKLQQISNMTKITYDFDHDPTVLHTSLRSEAFILKGDRVRLFKEAIADGECFGMYPIRNGMLDMNISFSDVVVYKENWEETE